MKRRKLTPWPTPTTFRWKNGFQLHLQEEFAARYHIPLGTLRDWEQHRSEPDQAARAFLKVIAKEPDIVARALAEDRPAAAE
jgi:hypothetical protein